MLGSLLQRLRHLFQNPTTTGLTDTPVTPPNAPQDRADTDPPAPLPEDDQNTPPRPTRKAWPDSNDWPPGDQWRLADDEWDHDTDDPSRSRKRRSTELIAWKRYNWIFQAAAATDAGPIRSINEDDFVLEPGTSFCAVADGMGGNYSPAGTLLLKALTKELQARHPHEDPLHPCPPTQACQSPSSLRQCLETINLDYLALTKQHLELTGSGATIAAIRLCCDQAHIAHVGDSRVYHLRDGTLTALTLDHTLINEYTRMAIDPPDEPLPTNYHRIVTRAMGVFDGLDVEQHSQPLTEGDIFLLCTDGLHGQLPDDQIASLLHTHLPDLPAACAALIAASTQAPHDALPHDYGHDNVAVLLLHVAKDLREEQEQNLHKQKQTLEDVLFD